MDWGFNDFPQKSEGIPGILIIFSTLTELVMSDIYSHQ
jgi:hypothetical protein